MYVLTRMRIIKSRIINVAVYSFESIWRAFYFNVKNKERACKNFLLFSFSILIFYSNGSFFYFACTVLFYVYSCVRQQWNVGYMVDTFRETRPGTRIRAKLEKQQMVRVRKICVPVKCADAGPNSWIIQSPCILHEHLNGPVNLSSPLDRSLTPILLRISDTVW